MASNGTGELEKVKANLKSVRERMNEYHRANEQHARELKKVRDAADEVPALEEERAALEAEIAEKEKETVLLGAELARLKRKHAEGRQEIESALPAIEKLFSVVGVGKLLELYRKGGDAGSRQDDLERELHALGFSLTMGKVGSSSLFAADHPVYGQVTARSDPEVKLVARARSRIAERQSLKPLDVDPNTLVIGAENPPGPHARVQVAPPKHRGSYDKKVRETL